MILPVGGALQRTALLLSPETGLLDSPEIGDHGHVKAKALLIPDLVPGRLVVLESELARGTYRIEKAEYTGDTAGEDWDVELDLKLRS